MKIIRIRKESVSARRTERAKILESVDAQLRVEKEEKKEPVWRFCRLTGRTYGFSGSLI